jgi:hypothetical protein
MLDGTMGQTDGEGGNQHLLDKRSEQLVSRYTELLEKVRQLRCSVSDAARSSVAIENSSAGLTA